jgi:hypothetical protein
VRRSPERGQALPLLVAVLVVAAVVALVVADLGVAAVERAKARTAADAAALAGAAGGEGAARQMAGANGGQLVSFVVDGLVVEAVVRYGRATARATAEAIPPVPAGMTPAEAAARDRGLCQQSPSTGPVHFGGCLPTSPG